MTMLAAHAAATLAAALWLRRYERRAWLAARRLWVALLLAAWPLVRPPVAAAAPLHALPARPTLPRRPALATASGLRAPPR
jgi:hypothetical protein